jgi:hypothetical protein
MMRWLKSLFHCRIEVPYEREIRAQLRESNDNSIQTHRILQDAMDLLEPSVDSWFGKVAEKDRR